MDSLAALVAALPAPRVVWLMIPAGEATEATLAELAPLLARGDTIVDGGNSNYKDTQRRAREHREARRGLRGLRHQRRRVGPRERLQPDDRRRRGGGRAPAPDLRDARAGEGPRLGARGSVGRGPLHQDDPQRHRVRPDAGLRRGLLDPRAQDATSSSTCPQVAEIWRHGSVVRSWLLDLTAEALKENPSMDGIAPHVADSGESTN